jgi:ABC-type glycerol-3-phosphate transport system substrate-binding protein
MLKAAIVATLGFAGVAKAEETVVWWDFLGGGDGVRMKKLIEDFNAAHAGQITDGEFLAGDNGEKLANALGVLSEWTAAGLQSTYTDYPATVALFTSGEAAMISLLTATGPDTSRTVIRNS